MGDMSEMDDEIDDGNLDDGGETVGDGEEDGDQRSEVGGRESEDDDDEVPEGKAGGVKFSEEQQRAVNGLLAKEKRSRKEAEAKLAEAEAERNELKTRYGDADGDTVLKAAREAGVMPEMMTADEAQGVTKMENAKQNSRYFTRMLRNDTESAEFDVGGKKLTRREVGNMANDWEDEAERLERKYGPVKAKAAAAAKEVWKLGLAAKKQGWMPGKKDEGKRLKAEDGGRKTEDGGRTAGPKETPAERTAGPVLKDADWSKVTSGEMSLEQMLARQEMAKAKGSARR